jgi:multiple sugar transport system substrate-binding protein
MTRGTKRPRCRSLLPLLAAGCMTLPVTVTAQTGAADAASCDQPLTFWHYYGGVATAPLEKLLARYTEKTGVEVDPRLIPFGDFDRTLLQSSVSNDLPDIALVNVFAIPQFAEAGLIQDLSSRVEAWGEKEQYYPDLWGTVVYEDAPYGIPHVADAYALWYNTAHFEEAGIEPPKTWDELQSAAEKLSVDGRFGIAMSLVKGVEGSTPLIIRHLSAGGEFTDWDNAAGRETLEQMKALVDSGAMSQGALSWIEDDVYAQFTNEQASMIVNSASQVSVARDQFPDLEWSVTPLPKDKSSTTRLDSEALTITRDAACADAGWELITWMQQPDVMNAYLPERNKLPVRKDVAEAPRWSEDEVFAAFIEQLGSAWAPEGDEALDAVEILTRIQEAGQAAISGAKTPEAAAADLQSRIDEIRGR